MNIVEIREILKNAAAEQVQQYPQYRGHFNEYVLVRVLDDVKTKMGQAFSKGEVAIALSVIYETRLTGWGGKVRFSETVVVWSVTNRIATHVAVEKVVFLENVHLTRKPL